MVNTVNQILKAPEGPPSDVEEIKERSNYLRGTLKEVHARTAQCRDI